MSILKNRITKTVKLSQRIDIITDIESCIEIIKGYLSQNPESIVLRAVFFVRCHSNEEYCQIRATISRLIPKDLVPVYSVIAQAPETDHYIMAQIDYQLISDNQRADLVELGDICYWRLTQGECKEIITANCCSFSGTVAKMATESFSKLEAILKSEELQFGDITRQWNNIGNITEFVGNLQNYQVFNDVRSMFYESADWKNGYPAATGIGMSFPGIIIDFNAFKKGSGSRIIPVSNPNQINSYDYSQNVLVGNKLEIVNTKTSPKFERAKIVSDNKFGILYISGTASIIGEETVGIGNIEKQTITTLENIQSLIKSARQVDLERIPNFNKGHFACLRCYVKQPEYIPVVKLILDKYHARIPNIVVHADICRDDLLVEIEGEYHFEYS